MSWNDERTKLLKSLWAGGESAAEIAVKLNQRFGVEFTRNAVLGKVDRLNLPARLRRRRSSVAKAISRKRAVKPASPIPTQGNPAFRSLTSEPYTPGPELVIPLAERKSLMDLERKDCRWPIGDPQSAYPEFHFCGREKIPGLPYCEPHARRAFTPAPIRRQVVVANDIQPVKREVENA